MKTKKFLGGLAAFLLCAAAAAGVLVLNAPSTTEIAASGQQTTRTLVAGGQAFGVKFYTQGVVVVDMSEFETDSGMKNPARDAGLRQGDVILSINSQIVSTNADISDLVAQSEGAPLSVEYSRGGEVSTVTVTPLYSRVAKGYKLGLWVRDSAAGVGTITYIDPASGRFGALGHGITDVDTGQILPISEGEVLGAHIGSVVRGKAGMPGQLKGAFIPSAPFGTLNQNTDRGVFGSAAESSALAFSAPSYPIASKDELHTGAATIRCTVEGTEPQEFSVEIESISSRRTETKNFTVRVTDPRLLELTGGIVQGMSGSPILQDGKLVGALTHVFVSDPTQGYGIFIENMLAADENPS